MLVDIFRITSLYLIISCSRGKLLFGFSDHELQEKGGYDLIHPDDLSYYAAAHQERKFMFVWFIN